MEELTRDSPKVVALGEMGLDFFRNLSPPDVQAAAFRRQLQLARRLRKPVVLHVRDAHEEALAILAEESVADVGGVMHCFSADVAVARRCLDLGLLISLAGPVTYKTLAPFPTWRGSCRRIGSSSRRIARTCLPSPTAVGAIEPAHVALTAARVAELRGADRGALAMAMTANAARLFRVARGGSRSDEGRPQSWGGVSGGSGRARISRGAMGVAAGHEDDHSAWSPTLGKGWTDGRADCFAARPRCPGFRGGRAPRAPRPGRGSGAPR